MAGAFYDAEPERLRRDVARMLEAAGVPEADVEPRMLIVPHAGLVYSGQVAAVAYRLLPEVSRIVLVGPSHFVAFGGVAAPEAEAFATPLGEVPIDVELEARAGVVTSAEAHAREHSLEVQLPFLQQLLGEFTMLPLLTGEVPPTQVGDVLDGLLADGVFGVISSDLSHYLDYDEARRRDQRTAAAITGLRSEALVWDDACGRVPIQAALIVARRRGWQCRLLDLRNSGDTAGSRRRVVGYGAFALGPMRTGIRRDPQPPGASS